MTKGWVDELLCQVLTVASTISFVHHSPCVALLRVPRRFFNTNNLWVHLPQLKATLSANGGSLPLPLIRNKKTVNPRDSKSAPVFQLETAMGSAIECFDNAGGVQTHGMHICARWVHRLVVIWSSDGCHLSCCFLGYCHSDAVEDFR